MCSDLCLLPVQGERLTVTQMFVPRVYLSLSFSQTAHSEMLVVPLLNIRRSDLLLRSDNVYLLRQLALSPDLLLFRDQLDLRALHRAGRLRLTLVDHNVLPR